VRVKENGVLFDDEKVADFFQWFVGKKIRAIDNVLGVACADAQQKRQDDPPRQTAVARVRSE